MSARPPAVGDLLVDEATAVASPPALPWVGRMQRVASDGRYVLVSATGYAWSADPVRSRPANGAEREAFAHDAEALRREVADAVRRTALRTAR
ncbi:hypothetical protein [Streptomyces sp. NRRL F-5053]|uniref:hypothetical protein n=1 Tax=Streptomyces sp. NRRL F-5053 TaxID=1463854 RepID=UPI00099CF99F|nr:hypothetical protein [Streptomyces sp. NRRL F-5053]